MTKLFDALRSKGILFSFSLLNSDEITDGKREPIKSFEEYTERRKIVIKVSAEFGANY